MLFFVCFSLRWGGGGSTIHSRRVLFFCFFVQVEISSRALIPLFMLGLIHTGSANWDDFGQMFPDKFRVNSFPNMFPHYSDTPTSLGRGRMRVLDITCRLQFLQNDRLFVCLFVCLFVDFVFVFTCHCGYTGAERTSNKSQHTKLNLEKKFLPLLLQGFELATFRSRVKRSYQQAVSAVYRWDNCKKQQNKYQLFSLPLSLTV